MRETTEIERADMCTKARWNKRYAYNAKEKVDSNTSDQNISKNEGTTFKRCPNQTKQAKHADDTQKASLKANTAAS